MEEIDIQKLKTRISEIEEALKEIRQFIGISEKEFWNDRRNILAVEQLLLRAIEASGGICLHIAAKKLKKGAESFAQCFDMLSAEGVVSKNLSENLTRMARFRNLLIHRYWEANEKKIYEYVLNNLQDFEDFIQEIKTVIE